MRSYYLFKNRTYLPAGVSALSASGTHTSRHTCTHTTREQALQMLVYGLWKPPSVPSCPGVILRSTLPLKMRNAVLGSSSNQCSRFLLAWPGDRAMERGCEDGEQNLAPGVRLPLSCPAPWLTWGTMKTLRGGNKDCDATVHGACKWCHAPAFFSCNPEGDCR